MNEPFPIDLQYIFKGPSSLFMLTVNTTGRMVIPND